MTTKRLVHFVASDPHGLEKVESCYDNTRLRRDIELLSSSLIMSLVSLKNLKYERRQSFINLAKVVIIV